MVKTIKIDEVEYLRKDDVPEKADNLDGMEYKIIRTYSAGVFAGYLESRKGQEVVLRKARRLWYWDGACSLSQLAMEGVAEKENCKFAMEMDKVELLQAIEIIDVTKKAKENIGEVPVWKK